MVIGASTTGTTAQAGDVIDGGEGGTDTFKLSIAGDAGGADSITAIQTSNVETLFLLITLKKMLELLQLLWRL